MSPDTPNSTPDITPPPEEAKKIAARKETQEELNKLNKNLDQGPPTQEDSERRKVLLEQTKDENGTAANQLDVAFSAASEKLKEQPIPANVLNIFHEFTDCPTDLEGAKAYLLEKIAEMEKGKSKTEETPTKKVGKMSLDLSSLAPDSALKNKTIAEKMENAFGTTDVAELKRQVEGLDFAMTEKQKGRELGQLNLETNAPEIKDMLDAIPEEYWKSDFAKLYKKQVLEHGERKSFREWLDEDSNISGIQKFMFKISTFFRSFKGMISGLGFDFLGLGGGKDEKKKVNPLVDERLQAAVKNQESARSWDKATPEEKKRFTSWKGVVDFNEKSFSLSNFKAVEPKVAAALEWAVKQGEGGKINLATLRLLQENSENIQVKDSELKIKKKGEGANFTPLEKGEWSDKGIENALIDKDASWDKYLAGGAYLETQVTSGNYKEGYAGLRNFLEDGGYKDLIKDYKITREDLDAFQTALKAGYIDNDSGNFHTNIATAGPVDVYQRLTSSVYDVDGKTGNGYEWGRVYLEVDVKKGGLADDSYTSLEAFFARLRNKYKPSK